MKASPLPQYRCHKLVTAAIIVAIAETTITLDVDPSTPLEVGADWIAKHKPLQGWYFVQYSDGYQSASPSEAFTEGYTATEGPAVIVPAHRYRLKGGQVLQFIEKVPAASDEDQSVTGRMVLKTAGTTNEEVIAVLVDRLQSLQGTMPCRENALAITHLEEALHWLMFRTQKRLAQGVEGSSFSHA